MNVSEPKPTPWHLSGNFAPVLTEETIASLDVTGSIPPALSGVFIRNGPNPQSGQSPHWFFGNGMLHGIRLEGGSATWYRNRYVNTTRLLDESSAGVRPDGTRDMTASAANTHVMMHAGRVLCLEEGHLPWEVDRNLETIGVHTFGGRLKTSMTAHPKICPVTGEMLFFGYGFFPPYVTYHRASATGELVQSTEIPVRGPTMMHDFNATEHFVIFMDLPVVFDLELAMQGTMPYRWDDDYGARLGVMPRNGSADDVRWFDIDPCYVFHPMNAFERVEADGSTTIVMDVGRFRSMWRKGAEDFDSVALLHRWEVHLQSGEVKETPLDDKPVEFGRVPDDRIGLEHRFGYMMATRPPGGGAVFSNELVKYDLMTGGRELHLCGDDRKPGEGVFVRDPLAVAGDEDAG
jgi:carotenoid cleavage dioxygenase-like enzyme